MLHAQVVKDDAPIAELLPIDMEFMKVGLEIIDSTSLAHEAIYASLT